MKNKVYTIIVVVFIALALSGCMQSGSKEKVKTGKYVSQVDGYGGALKVEVNFEKEAISSIVILETLETPGIGQMAIEEMMVKMVEKQSVSKVDSVSGATVSSAAFKKAVLQCVEQAGGNVNDF